VLPISEQNIARIVPFATRVSNFAAFLKSTKNGIQHLENPNLMELLIAKLPISKRLDWAKHAATIEPYPTVVHLSEWLHELAKLICIVTDDEVTIRSEGYSTQPQIIWMERILTLTNVVQYVRGSMGSRTARNLIVQNLIPAARIELARKRSICFACLESGHMARIWRKGTCYSGFCP